MHQKLFVLIFAFAVTNTCVQLKPPKNGALACDNWLGGELCQYQCKEKYDSFRDWKKLTVCQKSGSWIPHIEPFNCVQIRKYIPRSIMA